jgi:hypothetical protein
MQCLEIRRQRPRRKGCSHQEPDSGVVEEGWTTCAQPYRLATLYQEYEDLGAEKAQLLVDSIGAGNASPLDELFMQEDAESAAAKCKPVADSVSSGSCSTITQQQPVAISSMFGGKNTNFSSSMLGSAVFAASSASDRQMNFAWHQAADQRTQAVLQRQRRQLFDIALRAEQLRQYHGTARYY